METAIERRAAGLRAAAAATVVLAGAIAALLFVALFFSGGTNDERLVWIGGAATLTAALAICAAALGSLPRPVIGVEGQVFLGLLAGLALWSGLSILWSDQPDRSWSYFNREAVYLSFALLGVFAGGLIRRSASRAALTLAGLLALVLGWALLGKVFPSLFPDGFRVARLRDPVGYWNALALLGAFAVVLGVWLAAERRQSRGLRIAGAVLVYSALTAIFLTYSRGALVVCALALGLWLLLGGPLLETLVTLLVASPVALALFGWAHGHAGLVGDRQAESLRAHDGSIFAVLFLIGAAIVAYAAWNLVVWSELRPVSPAASRRFARYTVAALGGVVLGLLLVFVIRAGGPGPWVQARWDEFSSPVQVSQGAGRLTSFSSNNRWTWWQEAWNAFTAKPLGGHGAGAFRLLHTPRFNGDGVDEPHSLALQLLAETGIVGFLLGVGLVAAAVWAVLRGLRRLDRTERLAAAALAACAFAYLVHAQVDYDWDFLAITAPVMLIVGALAAAGRPEQQAVRRPSLLAGLWAAGTFVLALGIVYSLGAPWLANRRVQTAIDRVARGDVSGSIAAAKEARALDPLSLDPLYIWAAAEASLTGKTHRVQAGRLYLAATRLEPRNAQTWYELGAFYQRTLRDDRLAYQALNHSYTLNPYGPAGVRCGPLDLARARVNGKVFKCRRPPPGARP
ncbi:MAG: hypothetical protein QOE36_3332 [Gaiellaceae bacterium]|nr:hypothetical protein [Gaiellaceae bacterium]